MLTGGGVFSSLIIFMATGIFAGVVVNLLHVVVKITKNNFIVIFISDFLCVAISYFIFYMVCLKYYFADIKLYYLACFLMGITFENIFIKNLVANPLNYVYNVFKRKNKIKKELEYDKIKNDKDD